MDRSDTVANSVLGGAAWGATLLTVEVLIVAAVDGRFDALSYSALAGGLAGILAGGLAGAVLFALGRVRRGSPARTGAFGALFPILALGSSAAVLLVQIHDRWDAPSWSARAVGLTLALIALVVLVVRGLGPVIGRAGALVWGGSSARQACLSLLVLAAGWSLSALAPIPARLEPVVWPEAPGDEPAPTDADRGSRRLLLLGLDGARWSVLEPLLRDGRMPHLAGLLERGIHGTLRSSGEEGISPIAWTTLMTGQLPSVHGITGWDNARTSRRRVKAIWNILHDRGFRVNVAGVVASYPAEEVGGGMIAGIPAPGMAINYRGWLAGTDDDHWPRGPLPVKLEPAAEGRSEKVLIGPLTSPALAGTSVFRLIRRFRPELARRLSRWVGPSLSLEVSFERDDGVWRLGLHSSDPAVAPIAVAQNEWSPWLEVRIGDVAYRTRLAVLSADAAQPSFYLATLYRAPRAGSSAPSMLLPLLERRYGPLPPDTLGWPSTQDPRILAAVRDYSLELGRSRALATLHLMRASAWDASIHVVTVTDRLQHGYWRFREPETYLRELRRLPTGSPLAARFSEADLQVIADHADEFKDTIDRCYEEVDRWLGAFLSETNESTLIAVVSDHGAEGGVNPVVPWAGKHHPDGIYLIAGPAVTSAGVGPALDQQDVVPLLLAHLGLPAAEDLAGAVPEALRPRNADGSPVALPAAIPTFETEPPAETAPAEDPEVEELLKSLGYVG